jgi:hypothetical protein
MWYLPLSKEVHTLFNFAAAKLLSLKGAKRTSADILSHLIAQGGGDEDNTLTDEELVCDTVFAIQAGKAVFYLDPLCSFFFC